MGFARLGEQGSLILGDAAGRQTHRVQFSPGFAEREGIPIVRIASDFAVRGAVLELDTGGGWRRLDARGLEAAYDPARGPWSLRVRTGLCVGAAIPGRYRVWLETRDRDGGISRSDAPIGLRIAATPWWICALPLAIGVALAALIAFVVYGYLRPSRFPPQLGVALADGEDLEDGFFLLLRAQKGSGIGFYRDARAYVREDYRVCGNPAGAVARLRADAGRVRIQPVRGAKVLWSNAEGQWEPLRADESTATLGTLYRSERGNLYFALRSR
jgi:hypothetical protein